MRRCLDPLETSQKYRWYFFAEWKSLSVCLRSTGSLHNPTGISPKDWAQAVQRPAPAALFSERKTIRNDALLEVSFNQIRGQISCVCLSPILLKPKFQKFFHPCEVGEGLFFQYLPINQTVNIFLDKNQTDKPLLAECHPYSDFLWMQILH